MTISRRDFLSASAIAAGGLIADRAARPDSAPASGFALNYMLASSMYGCMDLADIVPEAPKIGASALDIWPRVHGNQREQLDEMGEVRFAELLRSHGVRLGCITQYKLGPFGLQDEMKLAARLGCRLIVTGGKGPKDATGDDLKSAVRSFVEQMKPHLDTAAETGVVIAIENHGKNMICHPDSMKWLMEFRPSKHLGIALAPYHLPQDAAMMAGLIRSLGEGISLFYAWQHGMGSTGGLPKDQERLQMPGRGDLDFMPLLEALRDIRFKGWTEVFMHPEPRGTPICETAAAVTEEINRARTYLDACIAAL